MGPPLNISLSEALQPSISEEHLPTSTVGTIVVLAAVLTFALQLVLVVLFFYKCWNYDTQVRETHKDKQPVAKEMVSLLIPPRQEGGFHSGVALAAAGLYSAPLAHTYSYYEELDRLSPATPFLPCNAWDLVQR